MEGHEEVSCDDGTVVAYLKIVWNSNGREGGSLSQRNCSVDIFFPISILIKAWLTWDSITFTWDAVEGALSYQIEVDGGKSIESATKKAFTKTGLLPDTEHSFRVRAVSRTGFVSRWSDVFRGKKSCCIMEVHGRKVLAMLIYSISTLWMRGIPELLRGLMVVIGVQ